MQSQFRRAYSMIAIPLLVGTIGLSAPSSSNAQVLKNDVPAENTKKPKPRRPDFAAAAAKLKVTEAQLKAALGVPANPPAAGERTQRPPRPDFKAAAAKLGVTEQQLMDALGAPRRPKAAPSSV